MALRDLLVYVDQTDCAPTRLQLAADLACRNSSHLSALFVRVRDRAQTELCNTAHMGLISARQFAQMEQRIEATIDDAANQLRTMLHSFEGERGLKGEWRCEAGFPSDLVPQHARYADLCILGHDSTDDRTTVDYTFSEHVLFVTGRPVLFVPTSGSFKTLGNHIAIAWNSSRASARALNDALPLIEHAEKTTIIAVNPARFTARRGGLPPGHLVEHLRWHGVSAEIVQIDDISVRSIADTLQTKACELGADVMVAGAFGHAKLREKLLGGVTFRLLEHMQLPILMSY